MIGKSWTENWVHVPLRDAAVALEDLIDLGNERRGSCQFTLLASEAR